MFLFSFKKYKLIQNVKNCLRTKTKKNKHFDFKFLDLKWEPKWFCPILWVALHCATPSTDDKSLIANVPLRTGGTIGWFAGKHQGCRKEAMDSD